MAPAIHHTFVRLVPVPLPLGGPPGQPRRIAPNGLRPALTVVAATALAIESIVFIGVHVKYGEITSIIVSGVLGLLMAFIAYGRMVLKPIS